MVTFHYICTQLRIFSRSTLRDFWQIHPDSQVALADWFNQVKNAEWNNLNEIIHQFSNVSLLKNNRVVFNIKGNKYRLIVWVELERKHVFVKFIGTHADYDKIDANKI